MIKKRGSENKGIRVLTIYTIFLAMVYLMLAVTNQSTILFGKVLEGGFAVIINVIYLLFILSIVLGLKIKHPNTWNIAMFWFSFEIVNSVISMYVQGNVYSLIYDVILSAFAFVILIDALIVWYLFKIKKHFTEGKNVIKYDKKFILTLSILMVLAVLIVIIFSSLHFVKITEESEKVISQLRLKTYNHAKIICNSKTSIEKDVCILTLAAKYDQANALDCQNINSNFYKFTCIRAVK
tara:strand:+ start:1153 stop:1866 length:714 start_codon:yes stop_codon:yes gene_type:complete